MPDQQSRSAGKRGDLARLPALVRMVKALEEAVEAVERIETDYGLNADQRKTLGASLQKELARRIAAEKIESVALPDQAPELWASRKGRKENPIAFIRRVYARWLGHGLKRGDIRTLDQPLYQALAVWMHRHPFDDFAELGIESSDLPEAPPPKKRNWAEDMIKAGRRLAKQPNKK